MQGRKGEGMSASWHLYEIAGAADAAGPAATVGNARYDRTSLTVS